MDLHDATIQGQHNQERGNTVTKLWDRSWNSDKEESASEAREISEDSSSLTISFSWFTNVSSGCRTQRCCSTTSRNKALLMILSALRFEGRSVMELPRKRTNRLDIIEDLFTLSLFKNTLGHQVVQICLIKWFHMLRQWYQRCIIPVKLLQL